MCIPAHGSTDNELPARSRSSSTQRTTSSSNDQDNHTSPSHPKRLTNSKSVGAGRLFLESKFLVITLLSASLFAFCIGTMCRVAIFSNRGLYPPAYPSRIHAVAPTPIDETHQGATGPKHAEQLPRPTIIAGKEVPYTTFSTKMFSQEAASTSHTVHLDRTNSDKEQIDEVSNYSVASTDHDELDSEDEDSEDEDSEDEDSGDEDTINEEDLHLPAGQHLLVDINHVDSEFLNSEARLAQAMIELIEGSKLTLLSYHCHSLVPMGVSCAGVLLESHVAFHTWPSEGVIAMDLFTCGSEPLLPVLPMIKELFGVQSQDMSGETQEAEPTVVWSHKLRGFREGFSPDYRAYQNPLQQDLGGDLADHGMDMIMRVPLAFEETDFQHVAIYQVFNLGMRSVASYEKSLSGDGSYESLHPEMYSPNKLLYLDGTEQSSLYGDAAYHEALVHPAMISHPNPRRAAIIGGGEGATLRELLKHKTIEDVVMVEIDGDLVDLCEEHLPEWNTCADIVGSDADSCFDDSRSTVVVEDAFQWFIGNFGKGAVLNEESEDKFDVIIMDALDPDKMVEIVGNLYKDDAFVTSLFNGLSEEGVFVVQLGQTEEPDDPAPEMGPSKDQANLMRALQEVGFQSMHIYDEGHSHFDDPWAYLVCFKSSKSRANWYRSSAEIEVELHKRIYQNKARTSALRFFDGPTMASYQVPSKQQETVYCRSEDMPYECDLYLGIDPDDETIPMSNLEVRKSEVGEHAGRGLFAVQDIPKDLLFDIDLSVKSFHMFPTTWSVLYDVHEWADENIDKFDSIKDELFSAFTFIHGYGYASTLLGKLHFTVDAGITTFCNHGCNGKYNYGDDESEVTEMTDIDEPPLELLNKAFAVYSPVTERRWRQIAGIGDRTTRDIKAGEEILCNYLSFVGDPDDWMAEVEDLRSQCTRKGMGYIQKYESKSDEDIVDITTDDTLVISNNFTEYI